MRDHNPPGTGRESARIHGQTRRHLLVSLGVLATLLLACTWFAWIGPWLHRMPARSALDAWLSDGVEVLARDPDPAVISDPDLRNRIQELSMPWLVRDRQTGIELVLVPPGSYRRGALTGDPDAEEDERPAHAVILSEPCYLGRYEVSNAQYRRFRPDHDSGTLGVQSLNGDTQPAVRVSWDDAQAFCAHFEFQLPTEAEWEYACRAGASGVFAGELEALAWYAPNSAGASRPLDDPRQPNPLGVHCMLGNVWEWCLDGYASYPEDEVTDPLGPSHASLRVHRGGSWRNLPTFLRVSNRSRDLPATRRHDLGFRVIRAIR